MVKKARPRNPQKIRDLQQKICEDSYLRVAVASIAMLLAEEILGH